MPEPTARLQKLLANQGLGSRRQIEELIRAGAIEVNGRTAQIGDKASPDDAIRVKGKPFSLQQKIDTMVLACHKPCGFLVTRKDKEGRKTVFSLLPKPRSGRWVAVGRLDINTSGLLIVCNDGELANRLMHPSYQIEREYHVRVPGHAEPATLKRLREGVMLGDRAAKFETLTLIEQTGTHSRYRVTLREGRNREVRRLWQTQGFAVDRLKRVRFGSLKLDIPAGQWRELDDKEAQDLYASVKLAAPVPRCHSRENGNPVNKLSEGHIK